VSSIGVLDVLAILNCNVERQTEPREIKKGLIGTLWLQRLQ
jgi:hypothetical protein